MTIKLNPALKYSGRILKQGNKKYSGAISAQLNDKSVFLHYTDGLLRESSSTIDGEVYLKKYIYDRNNNLVKVIKNHKDVFTKEITNNEIGEKQECINSNIYKIFDENNNLSLSAILSKMIAIQFVRSKSQNNKAVIKNYFNVELEQTPIVNIKTLIQEISDRANLKQFKKIYHLDSVGYNIIYDNKNIYIKDNTGRLIRRADFQSFGYKPLF